MDELEISGWDESGELLDIIVAVDNREGDVVIGWDDEYSCKHVVIRACDIGKLATWLQSLEEERPQEETTPLDG